MENLKNSARNLLFTVDRDLSEMALKNGDNQYTLWLRQCNQKLISHDKICFVPTLCLKQFILNSSTTKSNRNEVIVK